MLPKSVKTIGREALAGCSKLTDLYCYAEMALSTETDAFDNSSHATLHVPTSAIDNYMKTAPWSNFGTIVPLVAVTGISLNPSSATVVEGATLTLIATVSPNDATDKSVTWSSSDTKVATVDNSGKVTAITPGTAAITATANDGSGVGASCEVTVMKKVIPIIGIELNRTSATLTEGDSLILTETITPDDATDKSLTWSSSDTKIATVDATGKVTAKSAGTATITATANDSSGVSASCEVTVTPASYVITFLVDGEVYATETLYSGATITVSEEPTKEGHTFSGWIGLPETMPAKDLTVNGAFIVNQYQVTFKIDGVVIASYTQDYGSAIVTPDAPEREGYTFSGWGDVAKTVPASDVTYEGSYSANLYNVYYFVGATLVHTVKVAYGEPIPEYIYEPEEEGYTFLGWIGETYTTMPAHDVTYTANIDNGIGQLTMDSGQLTIYDLAGRNVTNTENLKGGIYIVNGKKVVIND